MQNELLTADTVAITADSALTADGFIDIVGPQDWPVTSAAELAWPDPADAALQWP